jgi:hypothetical protein
MNCLEIIKKYLRDNGYDGLCTPDKLCGCGVEHLCPCCETFQDCQPAYEYKDGNWGGDIFYRTTKDPA